jgi:hypothetical protein
MRLGQRVRHGLSAVALLVAGLVFPGAGGLPVQAATLSVGNLFVTANPEGTLSRAQISFTGPCRVTVVTFAWDGGTPSRATSCGNSAGIGTAHASLIFHDAGPHTATATVAGVIRTASFTIADAAIVLTARPLTMVAGVASDNFVATAVDANQFWSCAQYATTVDWGDGSTTPATCVVAPLGGASFGASHGYALAGPYTMTVTLVDRGGVTATSSAPVTVSGTVPRSVTLSATSLPNPSCPGQAVVITATATPNPPGSGTPTGNVAFVDGSTALATVALDASAHASLSTSALTAGTHVITVHYGGDATFPAADSGPAIQTVNPTCPGPGGGDNDDPDSDHDTDKDDDSSADHDPASEKGGDHGDAGDHRERKAE